MSFSSVNFMISFCVMPPYLYSMDLYMCYLHYVTMSFPSRCLPNVLLARQTRPPVCPPNPIDVQIQSNHSSQFQSSSSHRHHSLCPARFRNGFKKVFSGWLPCITYEGEATDVSRVKTARFSCSGSPETHHRVTCDGQPRLVLVTAPLTLAIAALFPIAAHVLPCHCPVPILSLRCLCQSQS